MPRAKLLMVVFLLLSACSTPIQSQDIALQITATGTSAGEAAASNTPRPTETSAPTLTNTRKPPATEVPAATASPTPTVQLCINQAEFVRHLSISDNTELLPGVYFAKVWRVKNTGTCTWTTEYAFVFESGDDFSSVSETQLSKEVSPGETIDIQVTLVTPLEPATYSGNWMLRDASGNIFGAGDAGKQPFSAIVVVEPLMVNERKETLSCG